MPNALAIIGPVIDEVVDEQDDDGDKMEVDGKGPDFTETLAAGVQCLLQCLNPATAETEGTFGSPPLNWVIHPVLPICPLSILF
jgi:proteasome component ECM29